jgi:ankyrin repeat protein
MDPLDQQLHDDEQEPDEAPQRYTKSTLRHAILTRRSLSEIRTIVENRPQSVRERAPQRYWAQHHFCPTSENRLPLAAALVALNSQIRGSSDAANGADVALYLLQRWPKAANQPDLNGGFPIHLVSPNWPVELVRGVVEASNRQLLQRIGPSRGFEQVRIPLHDAIAAECDFETIRVMVEAFPASVRVADCDGQVGLHLASDERCDPSLVDYLIQQWPDAIRVADSSGRLPLHLACNSPHRHDEGGVLRLFEEWPDALHHRDNRGRLPLHCFVETCTASRDGTSRQASQEKHELEAMRRKIQGKMARLFLHAYPEAVRVQDSDGNVPLHGAVRHSARVARLLVEAWPDACTQANHDGMLPLHVAVRAVARVQMVRLLLRACPDSARQRDTTGSLPLHRVVDRQGQRYRDATSDKLLEAAQLLVETWPDAVRQRDSKGMLPLHRAVDQDTKRTSDPVPLVELVRLLVQTWPDSLQERDNGGYLPLHRALTRKSSGSDPVPYLVEQRPESVREWTTAAASPDGTTTYLPLHLAVLQNDQWPVRCLVVQWRESVREQCPGHGLPVHMVFRNVAPDLHMAVGLIRLWPESLLLRDANGCLPLHLAVGNSKRNVPPNVVSFMVRTGPGAVRVRDQQGRLPIHAALAEANWSSDVAQVLVAEWPESLRERDDQGRLPLHLAAAARIKSSGPMRSLVEAWPQALRERDALGQLPLHASAHSFQESSVVRYFVRQWPESVRERDNEGRLALHLAFGRRYRQEIFVQILVEPWPESVRERDSLGRLPLHVVLESAFQPMKVAKLLVELWPQSAKEVSPDGLYPLQLAAVNNAELELLLFLAKLCPELFFRR